MKKLLLVIGLAGLSMSVSGCILHTRPHSHRSASRGSPGCHPSQYWDGHQCRHKGKGHGARKHDGR
jgi:hypothetical protein